jgi:hypothetical protein
MSSRTHKKLYEELSGSKDSLVSVKPPKNTKSRGYEPNKSGFNDSMDRLKPQILDRARSRSISDSDIFGIIESANVVSGIKDVFAVSPSSELRNTELDSIKASPEQFAKLRQIAKNLPDGSRKQLEKLLKELDEQ